MNLFMPQIVHLSLLLLENTMGPFSIQVDWLNWTLA